MDYVIIKNLTLKAKIGCTEEERKKYQDLEIDLKISIPKWETPPAEDSFDKNTVCYYTISKEIKNLLESKEWILVEELTLEIIKNIFKNHEIVEEIEAEVHKFAIPEAKWCGVRLKRKRT